MIDKGTEDNFKTKSYMFVSGCTQQTYPVAAQSYEYVALSMFDGYSEPLTDSCLIFKYRDYIYSLSHSRILSYF